MSTTICGNCKMEFDGLMSYLPAHKPCISAFFTNEFAQLLRSLALRGEHDEVRRLCDGFCFGDVRVWPIVDTVAPRAEYFREER